MSAGNVKYSDGLIVSQLCDRRATVIGNCLPVVCRGICSNLEEDEVRDTLDPIMEDLAEAYLQILEKQKGKRKEFFGLRDFYRYVFST